MLLFRLWKPTSVWRLPVMFLQQKRLWQHLNLNHRYFSITALFASLFIIWATASIVSLFKVPTTQIKVWAPRFQHRCCLFSYVTALHFKNIVSIITWLMDLLMAKNLKPNVFIVKKRLLKPQQNILNYYQVGSGSNSAKFMFKVLYYLLRLLITLKSLQNSACKTVV